MKKNLKILLLVLLGIAFIGTLYLLWSKSQPKVVGYEILTVEEGDIENSSMATGKVSPRDEVRIVPQISGIITAIFKESGDFVQKDDIIASIKVVPDMSAMSAAESRISLAKIGLEQIQSEYERQQKLFEKGVISKDEMERSDAAYKKAQEELETSQDNLDIVMTGESRRNAKMSNTQIRSTINGMILDVPVKVGNSVIQANTFNPGTTIASVADMSDMIFVGDIDETEVGKVYAGMTIDLTIGALEEKSFKAKLEYISPLGVEKNGAILFEIRAAANLEGLEEIRAGYSANAKIVLSKVKGVIRIPESCVEFEGDKTYIHQYLHNSGSEQKFQRRPITIGLSDGLNVEVKSGLNVGDKIRGNAISEKSK